MKRAELKSYIEELILKGYPRESIRVKSKKMFPDCSFPEFKGIYNSIIYIHSLN